MPSAASDLPLLEAAAREAGVIAREGFGRRVETWSKGADGPVTEIDLAVDALLKERLRTARPDYGWLSEETTDTDARLAHARVFICDPIDGTRAFLAGLPEFCISLAVAVEGQAALGVVYNPILDEMFVGGEGVPAAMNGTPIAPLRRDALAGARMIGKPEFYADKRWPQPWPAFEFGWRYSIAYRLSLIAAGVFDGALMFGYKNEWDTAGGAAILTAAGGRVTDQFGAALVFNQPDPRAPGCIASSSALHPLLIERIQHVPHPRVWEERARRPTPKDAT